MPAKNMKEWLESGQHLPKFMRDFHDAKDLFKFIDSLVDNSKLESYMRVPWSNAMIFTIDYFLWILARRGWTLQRSRRKFQFRDMEEDVEKYLEDYRKKFPL